MRKQLSSLRGKTKEWADIQTYEQKKVPVFFRTSFPSRPLPKRGREREGEKERERERRRERKERKEKKEKGESG